jgi:hypothetical protein
VAIFINFLVNLVTFTMYVIVFTIALNQTRKRRTPEVAAMNVKEDGMKTVLALRKMAWQRLRYAREMKLAFSGFALCICMVVYFAFLVNIAVTGNFDMAYLWYIACDIFGCINPYLVLIMSKEARRYFFHLVFRRKM